MLVCPTSTYNAPTEADLHDILHLVLLYEFDPRTPQSQVCLQKRHRSNHYGLFEVHPCRKETSLILRWFKSSVSLKSISSSICMFLLTNTLCPTPCLQQCDYIPCWYFSSQYFASACGSQYPKPTSINHCEPHFFTIMNPSFKNHQRRSTTINNQQPLFIT